MQHFLTIAKFVTISCSYLHAYYWLQIRFVPEAEALSLKLINTPKLWDKDPKRTQNAKKVLIKDQVLKIRTLLETVQYHHHALGRRLFLMSGWSILTIYLLAHPACTQPNYPSTNASGRQRPRSYWSIPPDLSTNESRLCIGRRLRALWWLVMCCYRAVMDQHSPPVPLTPPPLTGHLGRIDVEESRQRSPDRNIRESLPTFKEDLWHFIKTQSSKRLPKKHKGTGDMG